MNIARQSNKQSHSATGSPDPVKCVCFTILIASVLPTTSTRLSFATYAYGLLIYAYGLLTYAYGYGLLTYAYGYGLLTYAYGLP